MIEEIVRQVLEEMDRGKVFPNTPARQKVEEILKDVLERNLGFMFRPGPLTNTDSGLPPSPYTFPTTAEPRPPLDPHRPRA